MDGYVTIGTELDTKSFDKQIDYVKSQLDDIEDKLKQADMGFEVGDTKKLEAQYEKLTDKLRNLIKKKEEFNKTDFSNIQNSIQGIGSGIDGVTKKVTRWAIAIFGIRGAINFVRNSMGILSQYNEQMGVDVEYIRYLLASTLQPVIENLIKLAYKLLAYANYIAKAWFGVNLFANASTEAFEKQSKSLSKSAKKAKELQKTLTGFDEMNILQDNGDVSSGGGGGGVSLPSFPDMSSIERPWWLDWIAQNKDVVIDAISGIVAGLVALKLGLTPLQSLGIGLALTGIIKSIKSLIDFLKDPTFENFIEIIIGIGTAIAGVGLIIASLPVAITGAIVAIFAVFLKYYDEIKGLFQKGLDWIEGPFLDAMRYLFGPIGDLIVTPIAMALSYLKSLFESWFGGIRQIINGIIYLFKGDFKNGITNVFNGLKSVLLSPINDLISAINALIRGVNRISFDVPDWVPGIGGKRWGFNIPQIPRLAKGGIINQPGRGVMLGSAIGGERRQEGVIPLTDSQQMELLGEAIGRYITINANITNNMNGRTISRELQKIQNRDDFLYNR